MELTFAVCRLYIRVTLEANHRGMRSVRIALAAIVAAGIVASGALGGAAAGTPPVVTTQPTVSGTTQRGQTLSAQSGSWSGTTPISFAYQWRRCSSSGGDCGNVGSNAATYTLGSGDVGHTIRVQVTASNSAGSAQAVSAASAVVSAGAPPVSTAAPVVSGTTQEGHTLSVSKGSWSSAFSVSYSYRWARCDSAGNNCATISGATGSSYRLTSADVGHRLQGIVTAKSSAGSAEAGSARTDVVRPVGVAPQTTVRPSLAGTPKAGQTLTVTGGSWSGTEPITLAFRWVRCQASGAGPCETIPGAIQQSYVLTVSDVGRIVQAFVTATNALGSNETNTPPVGPVAAAGPAGAVKLSNGRISIPVTSVSLPQRLIVAGASFSPRRIRSRAQGTSITVRVVDTRGYVIRGALVSVVGFPTPWVRPVPERRTGTDGTVTFRLRPTARLPLSGSLAVFVKARKSGENPLAGVSGARMFQVGLG